MGGKKTASGKNGSGDICTNRKASRRFEFLEKLECGLVLGGTEVKSLRERGASLDEAYARIDGGELWLVGCHIAPYSHGSTLAHEMNRKRKLLVHRTELSKLIPKVEQRGLTLVPLSMYWNERGIAKVQIALARGKSISDKRQSLKERDDKREMERATRRRR